MKKIIIVICIIAFNSIVFSATEHYAVQVSAVAEENPPSLKFSWPSDDYAIHYYIFKKSPADTTWREPIATLDGNATEFTDYNISVGEAFEYGFYKSLHHHKHTVEVENGKELKFKIYDSWGDGISPHHGLGYYKVFGKSELYASGGIFGQSEVTTFIVNGGGGTTRDSLTIEIQLDVFGQETSWRLEESGSGGLVLAYGPYVAAKFGHIFAGIKYRMAEKRGRILLLVDDTFSNSLEDELRLLEYDLICDGWEITRRDVSRNAAVTVVKEVIKDACAEYEDINTLYIFGHVPVPYSGDLKSAHTNHQGAWPADVYYGELDGEWTDVSVNNTTATRQANHNVPGDGKFDQTFIESDVDLNIGRVDLYDLPVFSENEEELLRRYIIKSHDFRRDIINCEGRGIIDDNVGDLDGMAPAANGYRNFSAFFGAKNILKADYFTTLGTSDYLWSLGCGGSSYTHCGGVGSSSDFATKPVNSVFTILYGSYFGDWDNSNNVLRAPLASENSLLVSFWAGAPAWHLHTMALGGTIGECAKRSQNNIALYSPSDKARQVHTALMGDPALRLNYIHPAEGFEIVSADSNKITLNWQNSEDVEGYYIYRAEGLYKSFERLNQQVITDTLFVDENPHYGNNVYMVRPVKIEYNGSGSYYNPGLGVVDSVNVLSTGVGSREMRLRYGLYQNYPNPFNPETIIEFEIAEDNYVLIELYDLKGELIRVLDERYRHAGRHKITLRGKDLSSGVYFYKIRAGDFVRARKCIFLK